MKDKTGENISYIYKLECFQIKKKKQKKTKNKRPEMYPKNVINLNKKYTLDKTFIKYLASLFINHTHSINYWFINQPQKEIFNEEIPLTIKLCGVEKMALPSSIAD